MPARGTPSHGGTMLSKRLGGDEAARSWVKDLAVRVAGARDAEEAVREIANGVAKDVDPYAFGIFLEDPAAHALVLRHRNAHGPLRDGPRRPARNREGVALLYKMLKSPTPHPRLV